VDEGWRGIEGGLFRVVVNVVVRGRVYLEGQIISMESRNPAMLPMQQSRAVKLAKKLDASTQTVLL